VLKCGKIQEMEYLGIDIGGTKTLIAVFDEKGQILNRQKFLTAKKYDQFLDDLKINLVDFDLSKIAKCAVSIPGLIDRSKGSIVALGNLGWKNALIRSDLEKILKVDVRIEHDSCLGGLYEARMLDKKYHKVLYITISTGIGTGLIIDDQIDKDFTNSESGQMIIDHNGKMTKWELFASGSAIVREFGLHASDIKDERIWKIIAKNISVGLLELMAIIQPDVIIFSGGVGNYFEKFKIPLMEELEKYKNPLITVPKIIRASRPDDSVIYGCFELMKD